MFSSLRNHDYYCSCNLALNFILVLWPNGLMEQEQGERLSIYQIISKESSSNDKQLTKQARCRWHEPYGNFIENRYRRRGISNVRIKYSKTLAVVLAGSIVAGVPFKKYSALVVFVPWTNHAADTLGWKKKSVFQTDLLPAHGVQSILNPRSNPIPILPVLFLSSFSFFTLHLRKSVRMWKRSREDEGIIFTKKKQKNLFRLYAVSCYYWIERILESKLKNSYGIKEKFPAGGYIKS